jgi:hypothetical protein
MKEKAGKSNAPVMRTQTIARNTIVGDKSLVARRYNIYMSNETKQIIINRLKSLAWRVGNFAVALFLAFIAENIGLFDLPVWAVSLVSLLTAEITKYLNTSAR